MSNLIICVPLAPPVSRFRFRRAQLHWQSQWHTHPRLGRGRVPVALLWVLVVVVGCAHGTRSTISWAQLQKKAEITFQEGITDNQTLTIPYDLNWIPGDSLSVLELDASIVDHQVIVTGKTSITYEEGRRNELNLPFSGPPPEVVTIVYQNPDGTLEEIQQVAVRSVTAAE